VSEGGGVFVSTSQRWPVGTGDPATVGLRCYCGGREVLCEGEWRQADLVAGWVGSALGPAHTETSTVDRRPAIHVARQTVQFSEVQLANACDGEKRADSIGTPTLLGEGTI
jgi:hypothetical protein